MGRCAVARAPGAWEELNRGLMNTQPGMSRVRALIVEDNRHFARLLKAMLRSLGVKQVVECEDSFAALESLRTQDINVVLCDLMLPGLDGIELVRFIRQAGDLPNAQVPVLMISAYAEQSRVLAAMEAGADGYMVKPVSASTLNAKIASLLSRIEQAA